MFGISGASLAAALIGGAVGLSMTILGMWAFVRISGRTGLARAQHLIENARRQAESILKEAELEQKTQALRRREELEREAEAARRGLREQERRLVKREDLLDEKLALLSDRERTVEQFRRDLDDRAVALDRRSMELDRTLNEQRETLYRVARLSPEEAKAELLARLERELSHEIGRMIAKFEQDFKEATQPKARRVLALAIQRYAAGHTAETTVSTVDIPSEEMKGRVIGREGRNIRTFEKATGVDVIVDDTPGVVIVSAFDSIRREIARAALEKLILDGRIHPTRIEELVEESRAEMEARIQAAGQAAVQDANIAALNPKLVTYLGQLRFRTSYSQNVLQHSMEVAYLTGIIAAELGLDTMLGRRCGLLHDIGKAIDHEVEGPHTQIGADLLRRHGECSEVVHAALGHHDDLKLDTPIYTILVAAADAISASRPGARRETLDRYVRRLEDLETLVSGFPGVEQAYAIQAGREVRVIADSQMLDDEAAAKLSRDIAKAIEEQLTYPGEVKISVLRESRAVSFAR